MLMTQRQVASASCGLDACPPIIMPSARTKTIEKSQLSLNTPRSSSKVDGVVRHVSDRETGVSVLSRAPDTGEGQISDAAPGRASVDGFSSNPESLASLTSLASLGDASSPNAGFVDAWWSEVRTRWTALGAGTGRGSYLENRLRLAYVGKGFSVGLLVPWVGLLQPGYERWGLGNPVVWGERRWLRSFSRATSISRPVLTSKTEGLRSSTLHFVLSAGVQLEVPSGQSEQGLGGEHWEMLPYLRAALIREHWQYFVASAFRYSVLGGGSGSDGHAHAHGVPIARLVVNPHEHRELNVQLGLGRRIGQRWQLRGWSDMFYAVGPVENLADQRRVIELHGAVIAALNKNLSLGLQYGRPVQGARWTERSALFAQAQF